MELVWRRISRVCTLLCVVLSNVDVSLSDSLPGSCVAAGYTTCCDSELDVVGNCAGDTGSCFCDPSCREYSDCCSDLDEICPQKDVFSPLAIFIPRISYHSATVRWATAHINVSFNHTYYITYSILSSTPTSNESVMADRVQHTATGDVYSVNLSSLLRNATYVSTIVSASEIYGEMRFSGPTISTLPYPTVRKVRANWLNSSSAQVWWERLILSQNVDVLEYLAYVHRNDVSSGSELSNGELIIERWRFTPESSHGLIAGLTSHAGYRVSVRAKVRDADGTVFETEESSKVGVYIPGRQLFQLQGISSLPCSAWNIEIESQVSTTFRDSVLAAIRSKCSCLFPSFQVADTSLLCHDSQATSSRNSSSPSSTDTRTPSMIDTNSYVTFRAKLFSTESYSIEGLMELVGNWANTAPLLRDERSGIEIKIVPQCVLRLSRKSEPFCSASTTDEDTSPFLPVVQNLEMNRTEPLCITVPIFVATLAAEFLLLLTIFLIGTVITLLIASRRHRKCPSSELSYHPSSPLPGGSSITRHSSATAANIYSTAPSTERGSEEAVIKEDEGERPSNMAATASSHTTTNISPNQVGENSQAAADSERT